MDIGEKRYSLGTIRTEHRKVFVCAKQEAEVEAEMNFTWTFKDATLGRGE